MLPGQYHIKLRVYNKERAFGQGVAQLLELVEAKGSLRAAYGAMAMSSSKAWKILHQAEADLGFPLLLTTSGGANGGGARLTPEAKELLIKYRALEADLQAYAKERFALYFQEKM